MPTKSFKIVDNQKKRLTLHEIMYLCRRDIYLETLRTRLMNMPRFMKTRNILFIGLILSTMMVQAQQHDSFAAMDSVRMQFESETGLMISEFEHYADSARAEYERFEAQARAEYEQYAASVKYIWGGDSIVENTRTEWVEYGNDYTSRSIVNFDEGYITVEVALDENEAADNTTIDERLAQAVEQLLGSRGSTNPYGMATDRTDAVSEVPILDGIVDFSAYNQRSEAAGTPKRNARPTPPAPTVKGKELELPTSHQPKKQKTPSGQTMAQRRLQGEGDIDRSRNDARQQARQKAEAKYKIKVRTNGAPTEVSVSDAAATVVSQSARTTTTVKGNDGKERMVIQVKMAMATDYLNEKAAQYKDLVTEFSQKYQIEEPLIYAVMEQESRFNPQAVSPKNAYGLMQLVPTSGGCDAYTYVKKLPKPKCPEPSYLYVPRNNIELGTAYLRILMNRFASVADPNCRRLCVIAAYNTGEGNVSESFVGHRATAKSIAHHINALDYTRLYQHLTTQLSSSEARGYVEGVSRRREKYMK